MASNAELELQVQNLTNRVNTLQQSLNRVRISELPSADTFEDPDILTIVQAGVNKNITKQVLLNGINLHLAADKGYPDIPERDADKANITNGENVFVQDASDDPTVNAGWAIYRYDKTNDIFYKLAEQEGIDFSLTDYVKKANNLGDLPDRAVARTNLNVYSKPEVDSDVNHIKNQLAITPKAISGDTEVTVVGQTNDRYYIEVVEYAATDGTKVRSGWGFGTKEIGKFIFMPPTRYPNGTLYYRINSQL